MESEVQQLVEKFEATKRKFNEASDAFQDEIRKVYIYYMYTRDISNFSKLTLPITLSCYL